MAEAGDGSGHTPLTPEWTPAPRASYYPWQGDRPAAAPSIVRFDDCQPQESVQQTFHLLQNTARRAKVTFNNSVFI